VKVRGMFVVARQAEAAVTGFNAVSRFQLVISRRENRDVLTIKVELKDPSADRQQLTDSLTLKFQDACRVKPDAVEFVPAGTIVENQPKVLDIRKWE